MTILQVCALTALTVRKHKPEGKNLRGLSTAPKVFIILVSNTLLLRQPHLLHLFRNGILAGSHGEDRHFH